MRKPDPSPRVRFWLTSLAKTLAVTLAIVVLISAATGWLYWVAASGAAWPGPGVHDALPLDELAGHAKVPLVAFCLAFGLAGLMLAYIARFLGLDRVRAGLVLGAGSGIWLLLTDAVSVYVVRQVPLKTAFRIAAGLQPVYLTAVVCAALGALIAKSTHRRWSEPSLLAAVVAGGGLIDLVTALFPPPGSITGPPSGPGAVSQVSHVLMVPAGVVLLLGSHRLARGSRRAWQLSTALLAASVPLHLLRGPDYAGALASALIAITLMAKRHDFPFGGDPDAEPPALRRLAGMLLLSVAYGVAAIWIQAALAGLRFRPGAALAGTLGALIGLPLRRGELLGDFSAWFEFSVPVIAAIGIIWAAQVWVRPWRQRLFPDAARRARATDIVRRWGTDTLAPFTLRSDKEMFIAGRTLIAYRVVRGVALVSGDPIGPPEDAGPALERFLAHAWARGWRTVILGASERLLDTYGERGLHPLYHGDESVIDTTSFTLEGRPKRTIRQAVHRLERNGYRAEAAQAGELSPGVRAELAAVEQAWLRGRDRKGFTMELDRLFRLDGDNEVFVIGRDARGEVAGFLHLAVCSASRSLTLSSMPRRASTPNGMTAWLIVNAVCWARDHGYERVSLNFCPFAELLSRDTGLSAAQRFRRGALMRLKGVLALQMDNLMRFNQQFRPESVHRYVILENWADLPRAVIAAMAAEGYLPRSHLIRGDRWAMAAGPASGQPARVMETR